MSRPLRRQHYTCKRQDQCFKLHSRMPSEKYSLHELAMCLLGGRNSRKFAHRSCKQNQKSAPP
eukprot:scaffold53638_cov14-Tisochrysis_lutea.AAC.1